MSRTSKTADKKSKNGKDTSISTVTAALDELALGNRDGNAVANTGTANEGDERINDKNAGASTDASSGIDIKDGTSAKNSTNANINMIEHLKHRLSILKASLPNLKAFSTTARSISHSPFKLLLNSNTYKQSDRIRVTGKHSVQMKISRVKGNVVECDGDCMMDGLLRVDDERYRMRKRVIGEIERVVGEGLMGCVDVCGDGVDVYGDRWINCDEGDEGDGDEGDGDEGDGDEGDEGEVRNEQQNGNKKNENMIMHEQVGDKEAHLRIKNVQTDHSHQMNASQRKALSMSTASLKILGPPGTGKTYTLVHIIKKLLNGGGRVLVCAPSNLALDNLRKWFSEDECVRIGGKSRFRNYEEIVGKERGRGSSGKVVRGAGDRSRSGDRGRASVGRSRGMSTGREGKKNKEGKGNRSKEGRKGMESRRGGGKGKESGSKESINSKERKYTTMTKKGNKHGKRSVKEENKKRVDYALLKNYDLIFSTLYSLYKIRDVYDTVIVDECCQADEDELMMAFFKGRNVILAGDPYQLGPVDEERGSSGGKENERDGDRASEDGIDNSTTATSTEKDDLGVKDRTGKGRRYKTMAQVRMEINNCMFNRIRLPTVLLNVQYRMPANLVDFSNRFFYRNMLRSVLPLTFKFFDHSNLLLINTADRNFLEQKDVSIINVEEGKLVIALLSFIDRTYNVRSIGVITPYAAQAQHIMRSIDMSTFRAHVHISTVDSFQGQERDIVIISMVRSNWERSIGFMDDVRRMNVAMTRCKMGMVLVGDRRCFEWVFYRRIFEFFERGVVLGPEQFYSLIEQ